MIFKSKKKPSTILSKTSTTNNTKKQKAIFLDRDGVINEEVGNVFRPEDLKLIDNVPEAIKKINHSAYLAIVITNQSVIARNLCSLTDLENIHNKLKHELAGTGAKLDEIYYCPHYNGIVADNTKSEFLIDCDCRKPKIGLFLKAAKEYDIDLSKSFMIGDMEKDIVSGTNAGLTTIGVRTGYGVKETSIVPDYFFSNLNEAVDFIIDNPYKQVAENILQLFKEAKSNKPFIINIAGNTRSGKSTFSTYLKKMFQKHNISVLNIDLDNWILPTEERKKDDNIYDRFQLSEVTENIKKILTGHAVIANGYAHHKTWPMEKKEYQYKKEDIVMITGIVALSNEKLRKLSNLKLFMKINKPQLIKKVREHYLWKGSTEEQIALLNKIREKEEYDIIEKESKFADIII